MNRGLSATDTVRAVSVARCVVTEGTALHVDPTQLSPAGLDVRCSNPCVEDGLA